MVIGFAFSMLGFLAAVITLLFGLSDKEMYKKFKRNGYLDLLLFLYKTSIFSLILTAFLAMFGYSENSVVVPLFRAMLALFIADIVQIGILTLSISMLAKNASEENGD